MLPILIRVYIVVAVDQRAYLVVHNVQHEAQIRGKKQENVSFDLPDQNVVERTEHVFHVFALQIDQKRAGLGVKAGLGEPLHMLQPKVRNIVLIVVQNGLYCLALVDFAFFHH